MNGNEDLLPFTPNNLKLAKTDAERARAYLARKRQRARDAGLCIRCCKKTPRPNRSTCVQCHTSTVERVYRARKRKREHVSLPAVLAAHERAGDIAHEHRLHEDAAQHYQDALNVKASSPADQLRISEKLAYTLSLSSNPSAAMQWFERALATYVHKPEGAAKAVEILLRRVRQLWIDARTASAFPLLTQAAQIAEKAGNDHLRKLVSCATASHLTGFGRYEEAESLLNTVGEVRGGDAIGIRMRFYSQRGIIAAAFGYAKEAFEFFERSVNAAKESTDVYYFITVLTIYGFWAGTFGNLTREKTCCEQALLVAREHHITWRIPDLCLEYADILIRTGEYELAHEYVQNALSYDAHASTTDILFASLGIPLALHINDETMLAKCTRPSAIDFAFRSGQPSEIGPVVSAFAQLYVTSGQREEAEALLHRAIEVLHTVEHIWIFPIAVARFGLHTDIPKARHLIELRESLPCASVAKACLNLFDAFVAQRLEQLPEMQHFARIAVRCFETLGWHSYANIARGLLPTAVKTPVVRDRKPFADLSPALTLRERQIAELVLKGMTNRKIALELSISRYTVDSHVASIMNRLGVRSRHQLADVLPKSQGS